MTDPDTIGPHYLRATPSGVPQSMHHLMPRLKGGKGTPTVRFQYIRDKEIHASMSEADFACAYHMPPALRDYPRLAAFAAWVGRGPPEFKSKVSK